MADIAVDKFLEPIADDAPCGDNLEYDPAFSDLERAARGKPEQRVGDVALKPAEPPRWPEVFDAAESLLERSRDLRIAVYLSHAALNTQGLTGFAAGMKLIHGLLQTFWDSVHPELDAEDNDDPTLRVNSLAALNDREGVVASLVQAPLVNSRAAGRYSLRHIRLASGEISPAAGEEVPDGALVEAAFMDCDLDELSATAAAAKESLAALDLLDAFLREHVGAERSLELGLLSAELRTITSLLQGRLGRRGVDTAQGADGAGTADPAPPGGEPAGAAVGEIRTREDAVRMLERLSEYFQKNEPSSPVPLLLQRAKRLVAKDFMEILRDLTPDGVSQAELIGGLDREE